MPCYYPIAAVQTHPGAPLQLFKREQIHLRNKIHGKRLEVPCQQCSGCRRRRSLEWAMRCVHEAQMHTHNSYITLTYDDKHLPASYNLQHRDFVLFMKALRNRLGREVLNYRQPQTSCASTLLHSRHEQRAFANVREAVKALKKPPEIKFYMAGEYGEKHGRPHYHALLFGVDFADKTYHGKTKSGEKIYLSPTLSRLWKKGYTSIGSVTFASAAYISRYVMKKRTGDGNKKEYEIIDLETGEIVKKPKEYNCMSRASGIGKQWVEKYHPDVYTRDKVITKNGREMRPPRFYDRQYKRMDKAHLEGIKKARELEALAREYDHSPERLAVQELVANAAARHQTRNLE